MRRVIIGFFAAIGVLVVALIAAGIALWIFAAPGEKPLADQDILVLDLTKALPEGAPQDGLQRLLLGEEISFRDVLDGIERAEGDPRVKGIVARLGDGALGTAQVQELRDAIARFRAAGKFAFGYADGFGELGGGTRSYYLATAFDQIWLQPVGSVGLVGIRIEMPYFHGTLDKLGIEPRFDHREEFKTAANTLTDTKMTPADREQNEALLHSVYGQVVGGIAAGRQLDPARIQALIDQGPFTPQEALDAHLIDHTGYREDAVAAARTRAGENAALVSVRRYLDIAGRPHQSGPTIAVIYGTGLITSGDSANNPLSGSEVLGADTLGRAFREAAEDASVRAILFRIDSPGGSATASETIWREVLRAKQAGKPIIVSMGNVAGSGGYYIAANANKIVAEPATLTGSIGVVGGKVLIGGLSEKLGITWDSAQIGANASIDSVVDDFTPAERDRFERSLDYVYGVFKDRVAEGRKLSADAVEAVAKGRVWSGTDAKARGLVDELGGFHKALALAKQAAGIAASSDVTLETFPPPSETPAAIIARLLGRAPGEGERATAAQLAAADRALALLAPVLRRLELAAAPPGALTMPPLELK
ncbi:MAG TPA: signal peptide peptidase SppA [Stellaceae bacterium]|nr:signal peptide peptidase SppA [Stellaceae bacterium]